jgi:hypothetical protein
VLRSAEVSLSVYPIRECRTLLEGASISVCLCAVWKLCEIGCQKFRDEIRQNPRASGLNFLLLMMRILVFADFFSNLLHWNFFSCRSCRICRLKITRGLSTSGRSSSLTASRVNFAGVCSPPKSSPSINGPTTESVHPSRQGRYGARRHGRLQVGCIKIV